MEFLEPIKFPYPPTFNPDYPPTVLLPPQKEYQKLQVEHITTDVWDYIDLSNIKQFTHAELDYVGDRDDSVLVLRAGYLTTVPNVNYDKQLEEYEKSVKSFEEWEKLKRIWDKEQDLKLKHQKYQQYLKLKEEFDEETKSRNLGTT